MNRLIDAWRRLQLMCRRRSLERGLDEELRFHIEQQAAKNRRAGLATGEALHQAHVSFGGVELAKEGVRDELRAGWPGETLRDVRYGARALRRTPGFTLAATLTIALGVGASTALFSVVNGVLIKPLPYPAADALVDLTHSAPGANIPGPDLGLSAAQFFTYRDENRVFDALGFYSPLAVAVMGASGPEQVPAMQVNDGTLKAMGIAPELGRVFSTSDDTLGSPDTIVLTHGYWQRRFGGDPAAIGKTLVVDSQPRQVIGVLPQSFRFLDQKPEIFLPFRFDRSQAVLGQFNFDGIARLRPGMTMVDAATDLTRLVKVWLGAWPAPKGVDRRIFETAQVTPVPRPLKARVVGSIRDVLWVLMGIIGLVLVIACANVANLLLVRTEGRQHELAIRQALGAGRVRLARVMLIESLLLGLVGGAAGLGMAYGGLRLLVASGPASLPRLGEIAVDPLVLMFTLAVSIVGGLGFGLVSIPRRSNPNLANELRGGPRLAGASRERHRTRNVLVVAQVALAAVLLVSAGLMLRSFVALQRVQPGFTDPAHVQLESLMIPATVIRDPEAVFRAQMDIRDRIAAVPGVTMASFASAVPMQGSGSSDVLLAEGQTYAEGQIPPVRWFTFVSPGYFQTIGTPFLAGRDFNWNELQSRRPVAIVSGNLAREMWAEPGAALGKRVRDNPDAPWREIVGVVADVHAAGVNVEPPRIVYWPAIMENFWSIPVRANRAMTFVVRSNRAGTESMSADVRRAVQSVNGSLPVSSSQTLADLHQRSMAQTAFTLVMLSIAAVMALFLSIVGIYGVLSYSVAQRTREIGIRVALGAEQGRVRRMFVGHGVMLAGIGVAIGLAAAIGLSRLIRSLLFGVETVDPSTYAATFVVLVASAALASYIPARRATRVSPATAFRAEI